MNSRLSKACKADAGGVGQALPPANLSEKRLPHVLTGADR